MKKTFLFLLLIFSIITTGLIIYSNNKPTELEVYSIVESTGYVYEDGRELNFNLYSNQKNPAFSYTNDNIYSLTTDTSYLLLANVYCENYEINNGYIHKFRASIPNLSSTIKLNNVKLNIKNKAYEISILLGGISIYDNSDIELFDFDLFNGVYSEINGSKLLVGLTIKPNIYGTVSKINVGDFAYGKLDSVISGVKYENDIKIFNVLPSYTLIGTNTSSFKFEDDSYFIPLVYTKKVILNKSYVEIIMNEKKYYIDQFPFMITDTPYQDFKERGVKGAINYA